MANCKVCGKQIPDGKLICNNCRISRMSAEKENPISVPDLNLKRRKTIEAKKNQNNDIDATSTFLPLKEKQRSNEPVKTYREPSMESYVKYNAVEKPNSGKTHIADAHVPAKSDLKSNISGKSGSISKDSHTTMFQQTHETKIPSSEKSQAEPVSNRAMKNEQIRSCITNIFSSYFFAAVCAIYTVYCLFQFFDMLSKLNPFMLAFFILNLIICINLWILFISSKFANALNISSLSKIRRLLTSELVLFIMAGIFVILLTVVFIILYKFDIFDEAKVVEILAPLVFKEYFEELKLSGLIQSALLIYVPFYAILAVSYAYIIKFIHSVFVNYENEIVALNFSTHAIVAFALKIVVALYSYFISEAVYKSFTGFVSSIAKSISFGDGGSVYGLIKLILMIVMMLLLIFLTLVYKFKVTDKEKFKEQKLFKFSI